MTAALIPFTSAGPLNQQWFSVASSMATQDGPLAVRLLGIDLVVWRSPSGTVVAAPDRCTHSKRPLSKGTVDDGRLVCAKHGWTFGDAGRCVLKPSGLPITENAHLKTYPCTERHGLIWICLGESDTPVAQLPWDDDERYRRVHTEVSVWRSNAVQVIESLLAEADSGSTDVSAELPFVVNSLLKSDAAEHRRVITCAPVDGRASVVTVLVWTTGATSGDDSKIVDETTADLHEAKSAAEAMGAAPPTARPVPDEETQSSDWKRRLLAFAGQGA